MKKKLTLDIDGVIFEDTGRWDDFSKRKIIPGAKQMIMDLATRYDIVCFTSRKSDEAFWATVEAFQNYRLDQYIKCIYFDKPIGVAFVDDKSYKSMEEFLNENQS